MSDIPKRPVKQADEVPKGQELIDWVQVQIDKYQKYMEMSSSADINFFELNEALANYNKVSNALLVLYMVTKTEEERDKDAFDNWYADKYVYYRELKNPASMAAQKYYSMKELEQLIRAENRFEYTGLLDAMRQSEDKHNFVVKLMGNWDKQLYVLQTLSKNVTSEMSSFRATANFNSAVQNHINENN